jgi:hypothetical protein
MFTLHVKQQMTTSQHFSATNENVKPKHFMIIFLLLINDVKQQQPKLNIVNVATSSDNLHKTAVGGLNTSA